jgi:hypothetical protein
LAVLAVSLFTEGFWRVAVLAAVQLTDHQQLDQQEAAVLARERLVLILTQEALVEMDIFLAIPAEAVREVK